MTTRKERKALIVQEVKDDKLEGKKRKEQIAALPADHRQPEKKKDREARKIAKAERKAQIRAMGKPEKKAAKKHDKIYRKVKARPRRAVVWGLVLCLVVFVVATAAPIVKDISGLFALTVNPDSPEAAAALENAKAVAREISDEGIVLLKNEDGALPLASDGETPKINVFGLSSCNIRYGGGGSGGADQSRSVNLYQGLENAGIEYNESLHEFYLNHEDNKSDDGGTGLMQVVRSMMGGGTVAEPAPDYLDEEMLSEAKTYSDNALIVISSQGVEASDFTVEELRISENQQALIEKVASNFDNVVIVVNAGNAMELGFLDDYPSVKAALWIGTPGPYGCDSLGAILTGEVTPSGRLVDTYAYDAASHPASVNFGDYTYTNIKKMHFINYNEDIYVGYRYFETRYADDEAGYGQAVQFPFGYGLSYTDFEWKVTGHSFEAEQIRVDVEVANTGDAPGKDVVEVYFSAPYTPGGIEKSSVELAGFAKTGLLEPGKSETMTVEFPVRDMASWDTAGGAYVLEAGSYAIHISKNVHEPVSSLNYEVAEELVYGTDEATGTALENRFGYADGGLIKLSRDDWENTYPDNSGLSYEAPEEVVAAFAEASAPAKVEGNEPVTGADNGIMLADLKGLGYDDPKWDEFLDQFTIDEMEDLFDYGAYHTVSVDRLGVPGTVLLDGPAGINSFFSSLTAASYPTEAVISSTWNAGLAERMGEAVGDEANAYGVTGWYAPAMNIHRTPQGGRNFEYFSEDPLLSGKMAAAITSGAQSRDILVFMKHFAVNDQETNARSGLSTWVSEQALREIYLRPFEITAKEGEVTGAMSSFIYLGPKWCGGNEELLQDVLRDEWGFRGVVSTDAVLGSFMDANLAVRYGNDLMLDPVPSRNKSYIEKMYREDPVGIADGLRARTHNICYAIVNYTDLL
ncbi:MAG: glycoside hydrolase family 3 C-terminal domain-containing protein [Clostridiales Family XIII bacterium]|nr:glycoside hydrolase family 3 C-terminal domain-containing protein [Clostridiales Family XIII bacterium]